MDKTRMQETLCFITDVFTGGDGGVTYLKFRYMMEAFEKQSENNDYDARQICEMVYRFERLIKHANEQ